MQRIHAILFAKVLTATFFLKVTMAKRQDLVVEDTAFESADEAFEMIELAINDIDLLTRAFNTITEVCEEREAPMLSFPEDAVDKVVLN